jgi:hypothetical protein
MALVANRKLEMIAPNLFTRLLVRTLLILTLSMFAAGTSASASVMTQEQRKALTEYPSWVAQSAGACSASGSSGDNLTGSDNQQKIFNFFTGKGLSAVQSAAILGNFLQESHADPTTPGGYLAQWGGGRLSALESFAQKQGKPVTSLGVQLDYVWLELTGGPGAGQDRTNVLHALKATNDISTATITFMGTLSAGGTIDGYENPGIPMQENRINYAKQMLSKFGGGGQVGGVDTNGCSTGGSPDCQTAINNAKILCEAKKYAGNYYSYGAGHAGYDQFRQGCPLSDISKITANSTVSNPGPCATDCSSLVSIAVDDAFGQKYMWTVSNGAMSGVGGSYWKSISVSQAVPGDIVTTPEHVEIVDHVQGSTIYTFGSHHTGSKTGQITTPTTYWSTGAWHWTGPGSAG